MNVTDLVEAFNPSEHPRGWHGRFREIGGALRQVLSAGDVHNARDAEAFFRARGINADLGDRLDASPEGAAAVRDVCRAVEDMGARFPEAFKPITMQAVSANQSLLDPESAPGQYRWGFYRVVAMSQLPERDRMRVLGTGAWGVTDSRSDGLVIALNDLDRDAVDLFPTDSTYAEIGFCSPATLTPYGRMVHELGHVIAHLRMDSSRNLPELRDATDTVYGSEIDRTLGKMDRLGRYRAPFSQNRLVMRDVSLYGGTGDRQEQFAELFATLNVPGALEKIGTKVGRRRVLRMRREINRLVAERDSYTVGRLGRGPII